jgi:peptide/nickel transport system permease protein
VTLARAKGYSRSRVLLRVALRNALIPALTLTGVQFTFLVGGTVLIEYIFSYPGIGNLAIGAVIQRDLPLIQGLILTFAVIFIITNLLVDMTYALLNPKLRHG